jgi:RTX calcium-binding nonapeptide repeat (4 copies)
MRRIMLLLAAMALMVGVAASVAWALTIQCDGTGDQSPEPGNCRGTHEDDKITGTADDDSIIALHGNDTIKGLTGNDALSGGTGSNTVIGGQGADYIGTGGGDDVLRGGADSDWLGGGGNGSDDLGGGIGRDRIEGEGGDDTLVGGAGEDRGAVRWPFGRRIGDFTPPRRLDLGLFAGLGDDTVFAKDGNPDFIDVSGDPAFQDEVFCDQLPDPIDPTQQDEVKADADDILHGDCKKV